MNVTLEVECQSSYSTVFNAVRSYNEVWQETEGGAKCKHQGTPTNNSRPVGTTAIEANKEHNSGGANIRGADDQAGLAAAELKPVIKGDNLQSLGQRAVHIYSHEVVRNNKLLVY